MELSLKNFTNRNIAPFSFKEQSGKYLLTNDVGYYCYLDKRDFISLLQGKTKDITRRKYDNLLEKGFVKDSLNLDRLSRIYSTKNIHLGLGTSLHIVVVTLRCDHKCIYCQSSSDSISNDSVDMNLSIAKKVVDRIFESPNQTITIEFQGGEPLVNFRAIQFIIEYSLQKNKSAKKNLAFTIVTNFSFMNSDILNYLIERKIGLCGSLDGIERVHNINRPSLIIKNTYRNTVYWLTQIKKLPKKNNSLFKASALVTITKYSLPYAKSLIKEYLNLGLSNIHFRPVSPFGLSLSTWEKLSYSPKVFLKFYRENLDYLIKLNFKGNRIIERFAKIFLTKILTDKDPNFLDIRSPCGAGIGQLAYNFNGDIYTCDEGRMFSRLNDESFRLGSVCKNSYTDILNHKTLKAFCIASCLDLVPGCSKCVYKTYCGVCPLYNYKFNNNIFLKANFLCKIHKGILDYLFEKLLDRRVEKLFYSWLEETNKKGV